MKLSTPTSGRGWAYVGLILGGAVSVLANVAHSFIAPPDAPRSWTPEPGAVVSAIVWPVILFIAVEILARVAWPTGIRWRIIRFGGMTPVALVAAIVSYRHLSGLLHHYGEETVVSILGPVAVDGLMVMATSALLATAARARHIATDPASTPATVDPAVMQALTARIADLETRPTTKVPARKPAAPARASSSATGKARSAADTTTKAPRTPRKRTNPPVSAATPPAVDPTPAVTQAETGTGVLVDTLNDSDHSNAAADDLLPTARLYAESHRQTTGEAITPGQLAVRMRIPTTAADRLLRAINGTDSTSYSTTPALTGSHNGSRPFQDVTA